MSPPGAPEIFTYAEGDVTRVTCPTEASYRAEIEDMCRFYGTAPAFVTIDDEGKVTLYHQDRGEFRDPEPEYGRQSRAHPKFHASKTQNAEGNAGEKFSDLHTTLFFLG